MSTLVLPKTYGDLDLLFAADVNDMWNTLEYKTNGDIDEDNVNANWASLSQLTLSKDVTYTMGTTNTALLKFVTLTNQFVFAHLTTARNFLFKVGASEVARVDADKNFICKKPAYFYNRNTVYDLTRLLAYQKPVIIYVDGTTINVEQNIDTANRTLIVFPAGPIHVTEDVSVTHKFRQLRTGSLANGYRTTDTGAADSGMRRNDGLGTALSLTANTWYFVYACIVLGGDDAGNNFILVADDTSPKTANWSTLDTRYGAGCWVYLGAFRYGHGGAATTTMIPFVYDHQGWLSFVGRAASNNFFGIRIYSGDVILGVYTTIATFNAANSGNAAPDTMSALKVTYRPVTDGDGDMMGQLVFGNSTSNVLWEMPSFGNNLSAGEAHGWEAKIANGKGIKLLGIRGGASAEDFSITVYISAVLDEWV